MANYSVCGIDCDTCRFKAEQNCKGCKEIKGRVFWGECELYQCNAAKKQEHCGKCEQFPCDKLKEWASSENPERIDNLKKIVRSVLSGRPLLIVIYPICRDKFVLIERIYEMSEKTKDVIILICISAIASIFFLFLGRCEFSDYQAYKNGDLCECNGEFGFEYTEFFIRGLISVISGMIIVFLRIVLDKKTKGSFRSILLIAAFLINTLLFIV